MQNETSVTEFSDGGLELAMQELETMDAPSWITALVSATAVSTGVVVATLLT